MPPTLEPAADDRTVSGAIMPAAAVVWVARHQITQVGSILTGFCLSRGRILIIERDSSGKYEAEIER